MPIKDPEERKQRHKEYLRKYYLANKEKVLAATAAAKKRARDCWREFKATLACEKCGQNHPATLDFHHIVRHESNRKVHMLLRNWNLKAAKEEIKKCQVLCANCHRIHHYEEHEAKQKAKVAKRKK
jgi:hypothetical protein